MIRKKELLLISCLRNDGRMSLTAASRHTNIPVSTIFEKLKKYHNGIIHRPTVLLNFEALGFSTRANICIRTKKEHRNLLEKLLKKDFRVNTMFKVADTWDYMFEGIFKDMQELQEFLEFIEEKCPIEKQVHFILNDIKKETFLSDPDFYFKKPEQPQP
ncbi:MAG: Lrp/AsnC family transcriptional regulator [Nanoarchaeota archaeon]